MKAKRKWRIFAAWIVGLAVFEQLTPFSFFTSRYTSSTSRSATAKPPSNDLISTLQVDKPFTRWLPFLKFGETVFRQTTQRPDGAKILESEVITHSQLIIIGLCSTSKYDTLARQPFDDYLREEKSKGHL